MAQVDMQGFEDRRFDLFISFYGSEELTQTGLPPGTTTRDLARVVVNKIGWKVGWVRSPSIFFDETGIRRSLSDIFKAIMQTRGGGVALLLLTKEFFSTEHCLAELHAFMALQARADRGGHVGFKFCFICLDPSVDGLLNDPDIQRKVPNLSEYVIHGDVSSRRTVPVVANTIAKYVVHAWSGDLTNISSNLGSTVQESFMDLCTSLISCDVANTKIVLGVSDPMNSMLGILEVFDAARREGTIGYYDVDKLTDVILMGQSARTGNQLKALNAYRRKWCEASRWEWGFHMSIELLGAVLDSPDANNIDEVAFNGPREADPFGGKTAFNVPQADQFIAKTALSHGANNIDEVAFNGPREADPFGGKTAFNGPQADQFIVKTALSHGASKLCSVRVLLLGGSERGKTSTVESLLGHAFVENRPSTRGIDLETHCLAPGLRGPSAERVRERSITVDSFAAAVSRVVLQPASQAQLSSGSPHASGAPLDRSNATCHASIPRNPHPTQAPDVHHRVLNAAGRALRSPVEIRGDNGQLLRIWDFGGQKEYEACHQLFISQRSVLMLAIDLQKLWCEGTRDEEFAELIPWLRCAFSLTERPGSQHVVVVGTRKNTCGDVEGAWEALEYLICKWSSTVYNTWVRAPATGGVATMKKIALENNGAVFDADSSGLLELEEHLWSITGQIIENSEPVPVKWRALLEELVRVGQNELFLTKEKVMEVASGLPGFPESRDSLDVTVMEMLRYCRDLGELILFEISSDLDCNLPVKGDTCIVFVDPEKLLDVLRAIVGPCKDVVRRLEARHVAELREKGLVDMEALDVLWRDVPKSYRFSMLIMLCRFDLLVRLEWHERGRRMVGIPALMPQLGSDADCFVERMGRGHDERDLEVYTKFTELFPVGLIGVLIASLHNTVGGQRTAVHDFRADGALLTLKKGERVFVKYVPHGQDSMGAHIKWLFRGKAPVGIAHRCLQQFYVLMQSQFRKVAPTSYRHVIVSDCALDLSCCPSDVADCDGHGCGGKGSVELRIDTERLWDDGDSSELRIGGCQCSRCTVFHDHAPLKDPVVGRSTAVRPSQSVISEPSPKRYDLLISCHGEEKLRDLGNSAVAAWAHVRDLASAVDTHVKAFARDHSRAPSVFLIDAHSDVYKGVMQLRGGGVGLFLLTREFFRNERCVGALLSCLDYAKNGKNGSTVQLRLVCLERDVEDIFNEIVKSLFPELGLDHALLAVETGTVAETAENITKKIVWEAWTVPQEGENHAVLGGDIEQSFRDLTSFFGEDYFAVAKSVLEVQSRGIESVGEVFDLAKANSAPLGCHNVEALRDITLSFRAPAAPRERNESAIRAYENKWMFARMWEWGSSERDRLEKQCTKGMEGRWESLRARLLHREESRERPCPR